MYRIAVFVYFVFLASDAFGYYCRCLVSDEAIHHGVRIGNEVEAAWLELQQTSDAAIKRDDVFLEAVVGGCDERSG